MNETIGYILEKYEISQAIHCNPYNQSKSSISLTEDDNREDVIATEHLNPLPEVTKLKTIAHSAEFIDRLAARMSANPKFDKEQTNVSELALRGTQSTIVDFVFMILQNMFKNYKFTFYANQQSEIDSSKKPDNLLRVNIEGQNFVLLLGEDKANDASDHDKLVDLVRTEMNITSLINRQETCIEEISKYYTPILYETNKFAFSLHQFNKFGRVANDVMETTDNRTSTIKLYATDAETYDLRNIENVYYAICYIVRQLKQSINYIINCMKKTARQRLITVKATPKKGSSAALECFTFNKELYEYNNKGPCRHVSIFHRPTDSAVRIVKYVSKDEALMLDYAQNASLITLPTAIVSLNTVKEKHPAFPHDYLLCAEQGSTLVKRAKDLNSYSMLDVCFQRLLQGLTDYHNNKLIHRDIKPHNLIIFKNELYIIDFGLAVKYEYEVDDIAYDCNRAPIKSIVGTRGYKAPEMDARTGYGPKIDCYSAGAIMLETLLFENKDFGSIDVTRGNLNELMQNERMSRYKELIMNLMKQNFKERWSAQQALDYLNALLLQNAQKTEEENSSDSEPSNERDAKRRRV